MVNGLSFTKSAVEGRMSETLMMKKKENKHKTDDTRRRERRRRSHRSWFDSTRRKNSSQDRAILWRTFWEVCGGFDRNFQNLPPNFSEAALFRKAQTESFRDGYPADFPGSFVRTSRVRNFGRALKALESKHLGADVHDPRGMQKFWQKNIGMIFRSLSIPVWKFPDGTRFEATS